MKKFTLITLILILISNFYTSKAQNVVIYGKNKTYAGKTLKLYTFKDRITFTPTLLDSSLVDSTGKFVFIFNSNSVNQVFIDLESVRGFLYTQPERKYPIEIPDYEPLTLEKILNPYFHPEYIRLPIKDIDTNDLNYKIFMFDNYYDKARERLILNGFRNKDSVERAIALLEKYVPKDTNKFYQDYKKYRYAKLRFDTYYQNKLALAQKYFFYQPPLLYNPAYMTLFNRLFDHCFTPLYNFFPINRILTSLRYSNLQGMIDSLIKLDTNINYNVATLITLKGMYDLFYDNEFFQSDIIHCLSSDMKQIQDSNLLLIANNILNTITALREGSYAPDFFLPGPLGIKKSLKSFRGKFIYLNFCHPSSLACKEQFPLLKRYMEQAPTDFTVVTILYGVDKKQYKEFLKKHRDYNWTILWGGYDKTILKKYKVVAFPTYYLIAPDGTLVKSPAPTPTENFEQIFRSIYKSWHEKNKTPAYIRTP